MGMIAGLDPGLESRLRERLGALAKPPGSLGRLEDLACQIGLVQDRMDPRFDQVVDLVFAGDHGLNEEGVSAYPSSVTAAMIGLFLSGRGSANALARAARVPIVVVDAGVACDLAPHKELIDAKIRKGTRNAAREPALTAEEISLALRLGAEIASGLTAADGIILGEMGIGNTASAALVMHRLAPAPLSDCIGRGAGHDEAGLARKTAAIERAAARAPADDPRAVLAEFGGCEIAMMAGAAIGAAAKRKLVIADGFISGAAVLTAIRIEPGVRDYCVFSHRSAERGHHLMLEALAATPILDLGLRLGEGTGGIMAAPILRAAARLLTDVATLAEVMG